MDFKFGSLIFSSNFDSGNLLNVEKVPINDDNINNHFLSQPESIKIDYEFNVWTRSDCHGTECENGNRTWFHFSVKGYLPGRIIRITVKNLNRQQRLYAQGYSPLYRTETSNRECDKWFRVRYRPTWVSSENNFQLTFTHRLSDLKSSVTYFAFCYPWSYADCQKQLEELDMRFSSITNSTCEMLSKLDKNSIYYKRELFTRSLDGRRIDLITITDLNGLINEREEHFDEKLFPEKFRRPWKFTDKKVFIVTSRVHPGETPSSHVFNGFLNFILRPADLRSAQLRRQYIFKLIPLLNPDGVYRGHYRTDTRGINLNRVYLSPDFQLHSPIYAAKSLLVFHHISNSIESKQKISIIKSKVFSNIEVKGGTSHSLTMEDFLPNPRRRSSGDSDLNKIVTTPLENQIPEPIVTSRSVINIDLEKKEDQNSETQPLNIFESFHEESDSVVDYPLTKTYPAPESLSNYEGLEVIVDTDSLNYDMEVSNQVMQDKEKLKNRDTPLKDEMIMEMKTEINTNQLESQTPMDNEAGSARRSIYRFYKSSSHRSNSFSNSSSFNGKTHHQWNLKGHQANIVGDKLSSAMDQQTFHPKHNSSMIPLPLRPAIVSMKFSSKKPNRVSIDSAQLSSMKKELQSRNSFKSEPKIGNEGSDEDSDAEGFLGQNGNVEDSLHLSDPCLLEISAEKSGIAFYVDLHGHCSKRGCFMYGNCLDSEKDMNDNLLYPKLISLNSPHFDFFGCNFSLRNMYTKDKRDGSSKEGAGRVAIWKHLGLIHSYTLECNYNTGRMVNTIAPAAKDDGRASPPFTDTASLLPPRYTPSHFEDVGKAMAIAALDMTQTNPWSRIINSEYSTLQNIREYIRKFFMSQKGGFRQSISFRNNVNRFVKQPSKNAPILTKTMSNQLDYRRSNGSQGTSMSVPRKSQTTITPNFSNQNSSLVKPILSSGVSSNYHQLSVEDPKVSSEANKELLNVNIIEQSNNIGRNIGRTNAVIGSSSFSKFDQMTKSETVKLNRQECSFQKLSCHTASIISKETLKQEQPSLISSSALMITNSKPLPDDLVDQNNQNNRATKSGQTFRRNSIGECYAEESFYDLLEKEKLDELKEILSDEKCFRQVSSKSKTQSLSFDKRSYNLRKKQTKKKVLGKIISYSTNDINY